MANNKTLSERIVDSAGTGKSDPTELTVLDDITASAAEINILDGATLSVAELNILDGVTATTAEINAAADGSANTVVVAAGGGAVTVPTGGGTIVVPLITANATVALPVPSLGMKYTFIFAGTATEGAEDWILTTAATSFFVGGLAHLVHGTPDIEPVFANGTTHNTLTINTPSAGCRVDLVGISATQWAVSGYAVAVTVPAFSAV